MVEKEQYPIAEFVEQPPTVVLHDTHTPPMEPEVAEELVRYLSLNLINARARRHEVTSLQVTTSEQYDDESHTLMSLRPISENLSETSKDMIARTVGAHVVRHFNLRMTLYAATSPSRIAALIAHARTRAEQQRPN